jgi:hypothetical protein
MEIPSTHPLAGRKFLALSADHELDARPHGFNSSLVNGGHQRVTIPRGAYCGFPFTL